MSLANVYSRPCDEGRTYSPYNLYYLHNDHRHTKKHQLYELRKKTKEHDYEFRRQDNTIRQLRSRDIQLTAQLNQSNNKIFELGRHSTSLQEQIVTLTRENTEMKDKLKRKNEQMVEFMQSFIGDVF